MTRNALIAVCLFMGSFVAVGLILLVPLLQAPAPLNLLALMLMVVFIGLPAAVLVGGVRQLARSGGQRPEDRPAILFSIGGPPTLARQGMIPGRELRWTTPDGARMGMLLPLNTWQYHFTLHDALGQGRAEMDYRVPRFDAPEAAIQTGGVQQVVRWAQWNGVNGSIQVFEPEGAGLVAQMAMLSRYRGRLGLNGGIYDCDFLGGAFLDASGAPIVQARFIRDLNGGYVAVRVTEQFVSNPTLPILLNVCAFIALRYLGRNDGP